MALLLTSVPDAGRVAARAAQPAHAPLGPVPGGALPGPLPLFPSTNWWNLDISGAPVDPQSGAFIGFINNGGTRRLHPDFGGHASPGSVAIYGFPFVVVDGAQPKKAVTFQYADESDGVDHATGQSFPFYPIPDAAITQPHWIEGGDPGNVDLRSSQDRHMLIVDRDNRHLYELFSVFHDGTRWHAGSGAFFDLNANGRRPDGWTSADAAGLAILPGLVRYDEVFGPGEIQHAFRVTLRATNGYVYPASHRAGSNPQALPMGARLRLKAGKDISGFAPEVQKIFRAMKTYGLIVADNGSDMYISGAYDARWNNGVLNPAFRSLTTGDFEVIQLGFAGAPTGPRLTVNKAGSGTVTSATGGIACGAACSTTYASGSHVTLHAAPAAGWSFAGWSGDAGCDRGTFTMTADRTCAASFVTVLGRASPGSIDLNGDGGADVLTYHAATGEWSAELGDRQGAFGASRGTWSPGWRIAAADFNGDGLTDAFLYNDSTGAWFKAINGGAGAFTYYGAHWSPGWTISVLDLDGDGRSDVFVYDDITGRWFRCTSVGDGTGGFAYGAGSWSPGWRLHAAELNGDGRTDLFLYHPATGHWFRAASDAAGGFTYTPGSWSSGWTILPGSFNGDRVTDFFLYSAASGQWFIAINAGRSFTYTTGHWSPGWSLTPADLDANGVTDLFLYNAESGQWFQAFTGAGGFSYASGLWSPGWQVFADDWNGDRRDDLLVYSDGSGQWFQAINGGPGVFSYTTGFWQPGLTIVHQR